MDRIAQLIRPEIQALKAYHVPDATGYVKLDAMENPYGWPEELKAQWCAVLRALAINRYPDPQAQALRDALKVSLAVPPGMELLLGNGSDELIQILLMSVARNGARVLAPTPTFVMYDLIARAVGMEFVGVPLAADFSLDAAAMLAAIRRHRPAVTFLAYPNNPTGNLFPRAAIEQILHASPGLVVLDEAYHAFAGESFMADLPRYDNLLVMRTLSKQGLAGLRLGMLAGAPAWLAEFDKLRLPYNINCLTQASAGFILQHESVLQRQVEVLRAERTQLFEVLANRPGVQVYPSAANFLLFRLTGRPAVAVFEGLKRRGVLIKNLAGAGGALAQCLRVTVGAPGENAALLAALDAELAAPA